MSHHEIEIEAQLKTDRLWKVADLAYFLKLDKQTIYDYRFKHKIDPSIFVQVGGSLRIKSWEAVRLALDGKLINS